MSTFWPFNRFSIACRLRDRNVETLKQLTMYGILEEYKFVWNLLFEICVRVI